MIVDMVAYVYPKVGGLVYFALLLFPIAIAQETYWVDPPPAGPNAGTGFENNTLIREGSKRTIKWHNKIPKSIVLLCQEYQHGSPASIWITPQFTRDNETEWVVDTSTFSLEMSPVFYIALWALLENDIKVDDDEVRTDYFNITSELGPASSLPNSSDPPSSTSATTHTLSSTQTAAATTSLSTLSTTTQPPSGISTPSPSSSSSASAHLSTGAAAGIGIACTVAFVTAATTLICYLRRVYKTRLAKQNIAAGDTNISNSGEHILSGGSEMYEAYVNPEEMPTHSDHHELDIRSGWHSLTPR
ncbi:hypothetical protein BDV96DRAFT_607554 [Lophiotrema nucula]|uniref:Mid2 domain-containing protein n=1 Tax=Lophiotrema nucula TaxID=690887 RepID=A0A6A5YFW5_9PLEO|nr:hypothetical protein BDV96DRAFT_607554 [Lophiotrema nucula]